MKLRRSFRYQLNNLPPRRRWLVIASCIFGVLVVLTITAMLTVWIVRTVDSPAVSSRAGSQPKAINLQLQEAQQRQQVDSTGATLGTTASGSAHTPAAFQLAFTHTNVVTTIFWVGETADSSNGNIANKASAWDEIWQTHYGGIDSTTKRKGYWPAAFTPLENPFYVALPYNDMDESGNRRPTAGSCPLAGLKNTPYSWCKNSWVAIRHNGKIAYAQWEDVGPFEENDFAYVFGTNASKNIQGEKAGLDVSPAVRDYLGLDDVDATDWAFVPFSAVPAGDWTSIITISRGYTVN